MPVTQPGVADQFIKDVKESTAKILKNPKTETTGGVGVPNMLTRVKKQKINVGNLSKLRNSVFPQNPGLDCASSKITGNDELDVPIWRPF